MLNRILKQFRKKLSRVCFVHVPKCAGSSVDAGVQMGIGMINRRSSGVMYRLDERASNLAAQKLERTLQDYRYDIMHYVLNKRNLRYLSGHFSCSLELLDSYQDDWKFVTLLRSPEERLASLYFYNRYKESDHFKTTLSLDEWLDTEQAVSAGNSFLNLFGQGDVDRALKTLNAMDIVGDMSELPEFSERLSSALGQKVTFPIKNTSPAKGKRELSPAQAQRVKELCRVDTMIYNEFRNSNS